MFENKTYIGFHIFFFASHSCSFSDRNCLLLLARHAVTPVVFAHWHISIINWMYTYFHMVWFSILSWHQICFWTPIATWCILTHRLGFDWISCSHWAMSGLWLKCIDEQQMLWPTQCYSNKGRNDTVLISNFISLPYSVSIFIPVPVLRQTICSSVYADIVTCTLFLVFISNRIPSSITAHRHVFT